MEPDRSFAVTPKPPYYAVLFTSLRSEQNMGYPEASERMLHLVHQQKGFLGFESFRDADGFGVTISYWQTLEDIKAWKKNEEHMLAQEHGKEQWYASYKVRICKVERDYSFEA